MNKIIIFLSFSICSLLSSSSLIAQHYGTPHFSVPNHETTINRNTLKDSQVNSSNPSNNNSEKNVNESIKSDIQPNDPSLKAQNTKQNDKNSNTEAKSN